MTTEGWIALAVLAATVAAFASGRVRPELVAMGVVLALGTTRLLSPADAFAGFGDPNVMTIAAVFVLSAGLERAGVAVRFAQGLLRAVGDNEVALLVVLMGLAGILSGVMNVFGAIAMLLPVTMAVSREARVGAGRLLMPLAIAGRLGGALTLIGKPSNLIANGLLVRSGAAPLGLFSFFPVGAAMLVVGTAFMATLGQRLLPAQPDGRTAGPARRRRGLAETYELAERLYRIRVPEHSPLVGQPIAEMSLSRDFGIIVLAVLRQRQWIQAPGPDERLAAGDVMVVEARPEDVERLRGGSGVEIAPDAETPRRSLESEGIGLAEVVLAPRSDLIGKSLRDLEFRQRYGLTVAAIWREGRPRRTWLADLPLEYGDALLVQGPRERIRFLRQDPNYISLDEPPALRESRAPIAVTAALTLIVLNTSGVLPLSLAALLAAGLVVTGGCVTAQEALQAVDWPVVVVTGGLLPLGAVLQATGVAGVFAHAVVPLGGANPLAVLALVVVLAVALGHVVTSVPNTIIMMPIALAAAGAVGAPPAPFAIAIACATSVTLLTPISHPVSLMVMGPGGYRFGDYSRVGAPLALLLTLTMLGVIALRWPM
jgi:di/tricarboxylate transporter